ncbi:MAG: response regulator [Elusimicrobiales bacterium]|nr:response regulator [Elusimicrobiales bacterium]
MAKKILIIDDDPDFTHLMSVFLSQQGFEVEDAGCGREGIKKTLTSRPDLVLLDYELGDMTGHDAAFWLRYMRRTRAIPVVALSAAGADPVKAAGFRAIKSCKGVIIKTQPLDKILAEIKAALGMR